MDSNSELLYYANSPDVPDINKALKDALKAYAKVDVLIAAGKFDKAIDAVKHAAQLIRDNRAQLGDDLFVRHGAEPKTSTDKVLAAQAETLHGKR